MDAKWFKDRQKQVGVTADDIAHEMGRSRSNVSHIYSGRQRMSLEWAKAFAKVLQTSVDEVLSRAGVLDVDHDQPNSISRRTTAGDVSPWSGGPRSELSVQQIATALGGGSPDIHIWHVESGAMQLGGYLPGDLILVDTSKSEQCKAGDAVIAQAHDWKSGTMTTLLRRFEPPVLVASNTTDADQRVHIVDGINVAIQGKVIACWRQAR